MFSSDIRDAKRRLAKLEERKYKQKNYICITLDFNRDDDYNPEKVFVIKTVTS